ncbi:hypothetical protein LXL04_038844 [Taraxacum kok-saghyz]
MLNTVPYHDSRNCPVKKKQVVESLQIAQIHLYLSLATTTTTTTSPSLPPPSTPRSSRMDRDQLQRIFQMFDKNGDARITKEELNDSLENMGIFIPDSDLTQMIENIDENHDGCVDIDEFGALYKSIMDDRDHEEDVYRSGFGGCPPRIQPVCDYFEKTRSDVFEKTRTESDVNMMIIKRSDQRPSPWSEV